MTDKTKAADRGTVKRLSKIYRCYTIIIAQVMRFQSLSVFLSMAAMAER
jgi:hypothetical protein